jgi:methionyl-tRNA formyltransferase
MNIVLLGHDDCASLFALGLLTASRPAHDYRMFVSGPMARSSTPAPLQELAAMDRALSDALLDTSSMPDVVRHASPLSAPNSDEGLGVLAGAGPDLIVSVRYRRILRDEAIALPRHGVINLHSGVLPDYQGVMATFWALLAGEQTLGCTLHRIVDPGIDTGPVLGIATRRADYSAGYLRNLLALYPAGVALIADAIDRLDAGQTLAGTPQAQGQGAYYSTPDEAALKRFAAAGLSLIDGREGAWLDAQAKALGFM